MKIKHLLITAVLAIAILSLSASVNAQTTDTQSLIAQLKAQIQALMQQIQTLQNQQGATTTWCHSFNKSLKIGDYGTEIDDLRTALYRDGEHVPIAGGGDFKNFDEDVATAVVQFQEKYASEILTPNDLSHGTGFVGTATRRKLNALYGCKTTSESAQLPSVSSAAIIGNRDTYIAGQTIKFSVKGVASDGSFGAPDKKFNVQAWEKNDSDAPTNEVSQSVNAEYNHNTGYWDVTMKAPSDTSKTYVAEAVFYCSSFLSGCSSGQINKSFKFNVAQPPTSQLASISDAIKKLIQEFELLKK